MITQNYRKVYSYNLQLYRNFFPETTANDKGDSVQLQHNGSPKRLIRDIYQQFFFLYTHKTHYPVERINKNVASSGPWYLPTLFTVLSSFP